MFLNSTAVDLGLSSLIIFQIESIRLREINVADRT